MKKKLSIALSLASAAMLSASVIEWDLPNLTSGDGKTALSASDVVFLLVSDSSGLVDSSGVVDTTKASNVGMTSVEFDDGSYMYGSYSDTVNTSPAQYIMAFYNSENHNYYALDDGSGSPILVSVDNANAQNAVTDGYAGYSAEANGVSTVKTMAQQVPEPTTAALALAGVALLVRRRRLV